MRPSTTRAQQGRSIVGKIVLALAAAAVMLGGFVGPALSKDNDQRHGRQEQRYRHEYHPSHRAYQPYYRAYQPYRYYAPPPVIYAPTPSPGISLFFDIPFGHR